MEGEEDAHRLHRQQHRLTAFTTLFCLRILPTHACLGAMMVGHSGFGEGNGASKPLVATDSMQSFKSCTCSHSLLFRQKYFISPVNFPFCFCFPPFVCFHSQVVFQWFALISSRPPFPFKHNVIPYRPEGSRLLSPTLLALNF